MRFAVMILYFDCEQYILKTIENCAPFVERIFISYSPEPWIHNKTSRNNYKNTVDKSLIYSSPHKEKIQLLEGIWDTEEDQRNHCLDLAKTEGYDFLIIQDADEFYTASDYKQNIESIQEEPDHLYYRNPWYLFWKTPEYIIHFRERKGIVNHSVSACFAVNLNKNVRFKKNRLLTTTDHKYITGFCYHLSYLMSDEQMKRKINTWGHSHQIDDINNWYAVKWLGWKPETRNISPVNTTSWHSAQLFRGERPKEILDFDFKNQYVKPSLWDILKSIKIDLKSYARIYYNYYLRK